MHALFKFFDVNDFFRATIEHNTHDKLLLGIAVNLADCLIHNFKKHLTFVVVSLRLRTELGTKVGILFGSSIARQCKIEPVSQRLLALVLSHATHTRHRQRRTDCRTHRLRKNLAIQNPLTISNRHDVGRQISSNIATRRIHDRNKRLAGMIRLGFATAFEQARVCVEHITRI